jgi:hypothetical protein
MSPHHAPISVSAWRATRARLDRPLARPDPRVVGVSSRSSRLAPASRPMLASRTGAAPPRVCAGQAQSSTRVQMVAPGGRKVSRSYQRPAAACTPFVRPPSMASTPPSGLLARREEPRTLSSARFCGTARRGPCAAPDRPGGAPAPARAPDAPRVTGRPSQRDPEDVGIARALRLELDGLAQRVDRVGVALLAHEVEPESMPDPPAAGTRARRPRRSATARPPRRARGSAAGRRG